MFLMQGIMSLHFQYGQINKTELGALLLFCSILWGQISRAWWTEPRIKTINHLEKRCGINQGRHRSPRVSSVVQEGIKKINGCINRDRYFILAVKPRSRGNDARSVIGNKSQRENMNRKYGPIIPFPRLCSDRVSSAVKPQFRSLYQATSAVSDQKD